MPFDLDEARRHYTEGLRKRAAGDERGALVAFLRAAHFHTSRKGLQHSDILARLLSQIAELYADLGDFESALKFKGTERRVLQKELSGRRGSAGPLSGPDGEQSGRNEHLYRTLRQFGESFERSGLTSLSESYNTAAENLKRHTGSRVDPPATDAGCDEGTQKWEVDAGLGGPSVSRILLRVVLAAILFLVACVLVLKI